MFKLATFFTLLIYFSTTSIAQENQLLLQAKELLTVNPSLSIQIASEALTEAQKIDNQDDLTIASKYIGTAYYYLGKTDSTRYWWEKSLIYSQRSNLKNQSDAYNNLGIIYQRTGLVDSSYYCYQKSIDLRTKQNDSLGVASSHLNMGALDRIKGSYESALNHYFSALELYESLNKNEKIGECYNSLGVVYMALKDYDNALEYLYQALTIKKEFGNTASLGSTLNNLAGTYQLLEKYDEAKEYYLEAFNIYENGPDKRMTAGICNNLGLIHKVKGEYGKAIQYFQIAGTGFEEMKDFEGLATVYSNLGSCKYEIGKYDDALEIFNKGFEATQQLSYLSVEIEICRGLAKTNSALGKYEEGHFYLKEFQRLNDSLFSLTVAEKTAELREKFESEKQARTIVQLENEALAKAALEKRKQFILWISITCSTIVILILIVIINRNRLKRKLLQVEKERYRLRTELKNIEIANKDRKITSLASNTMEKDKLIKSVLNELDDVYFESNSTAIKTEGLKRQLNEAINVEEAWNKFKLHFETVHPDFFEKLKKLNPKLTQNDLKHCAYIKMNLNSKEIGRFLNIMPKSVKMNRYRLRKKLSMDNAEDIYEFIQKI